MKTCGLCKKEKDEDSFAWRNKSQGIRRSQCKQCISDADKARYANDPNRSQAIRDNHAKRRQALTDKLWAYKSERSCKDCGYSNPIALEFDHLRDKFMNVSDMVRDCFSWDKIEEEISKCEIVCANCHVIRTHKRANRIRKS